MAAVLAAWTLAVTVPTPRTASLSGWLKNTPFRVHAATVEVHARPPVASPDEDDWFTSMGPGGYPPAPPPPPQPFVTLELADLDCRGAYVRGLRSSVDTADGPSDMEGTPPRLTLGFEDAGIQCTLGRLDVVAGPMDDGRAASMSLHMTEDTVDLLSRLPILTPVSNLDITASGVGGEFAISLAPRGESGLPAGILMPTSRVSIPPGGLSVILTTGNPWADTLVKGAAAIVETLVLQERRHAGRSLGPATRMAPPLERPEHQRLRRCPRI